MITQTVWLARPRHGNALDPLSISNLLVDLESAEMNPNCVALVIRAAGPAFCAGADVKACGELMENPASLLGFFDSARRLMRMLVETRLITIAAVQGLAVAGGLELVCACDIVLATTEAHFSDRHVRNGFLPAFGATSLLPRRIGQRRAQLMLLGGGSLDFESAQRVGLVTATSKPEEFDSLISSITSKIEQHTPSAISDLKGLINRLSEINFSHERSAVADYLHAGGYRISNFSS